MSNLLTVTTKILGALLIVRLLVAFCFDLQVGHKYLLSFVSLSTEQNNLRDSPKVH